MQSCTIQLIAPIPRSANSFSRQQESDKDMYESVRDEKSNEKGDHNATLSRQEHGVQGTATCETGLFLMPG